MKYKNIIKLRLPEIQLSGVVPMQLKFSIVKDHNEPAILWFETLFCTWECFNMVTELPLRLCWGQTLVLMQMTFLNNVRQVGRLVLSRTSLYFETRISIVPSKQCHFMMGQVCIRKGSYLEKTAQYETGMIIRIIDSCDQNS
jgi:hypothetical protein